MADLNIRARFILFCDYTMISNDGKLSIIGEFDHLFSSSDKAILNKGFLVASLVADTKKEITLTVSLVSDDDELELFKKELKVTPGANGKLNLMIGFENLAFNKFGLYKAVISEGENKVSVANLHVVKVKNPQPAQA